jgi:hypothetical protein
MNRLITSLVQLALAVPAYYGMRWMIADIKDMWRESH